MEAGYGAMLTSSEPFVGKAGLDAVRERLIGLRIEIKKKIRKEAMDAGFSEDEADKIFKKKAPLK